MARQKKQYRERAERAESDAALYLDALFPMLESLDISHLQLRPANTLTLPPERSFRLPDARRGDALLFLTPADESGLGATLTWDGERWIADSVDPEGPAFARGLKSGDPIRLIHFNPGTAGGRLTLINLSSNAELELSWKRRAPRRSRAITVMGDNIACVRFDVFDREMVDWVLDTLSRGPNQVMLDLRTNRGGSIRDLWRILSALLPPGSDIGTFASRKNDRPTYTGEATELPIQRLALLTRLRTYSAAEIMAAALASHGRAVVIGDRTAGSVLAAQAYRLPDGGLLTVPYADYRDPSADRLEGRGVSRLWARESPPPPDEFLAEAHRLTTI